MGLRNADDLGAGQCSVNSGLDRGSTPVRDGRVPMQGRQKVGQFQGRPQLERELPRVQRRVELFESLGGDDLFFHQLQPGPVATGDGVVDGAGLCIELGQHLGKKTAAGKYASLDIGEVGITQALETGQALEGLQPGAEHLSLKNLLGGTQGIFLQPLLRAEVRKHPALADAQFPCEPPDRQAAQSFDGGQSHGGIEDLGVGLFPVRAP